MAVYDNSQQNKPFTFQRGGTSSNFVKCTAHLFMKLWQGTWVETPLPVNRVAITYHRQAIPSPIRMPCYELLTGIREITNTVRTGVLTRWQCESSFLGEKRIGKLVLVDTMLALIWQEKQTQNLQEVLFLLRLVGTQGDKIRRRHRNVINIAPC